MSSDLTYHSFDGVSRRFWSYSPIPGAWHDLLSWLSGGEESEANRYDLVEMFDRDEDSIEVVTFDGEPIGVLDRADIGRADLARFETYEEIKRREGWEDACAELHADVRRDVGR